MINLLKEKSKKEKTRLCVSNSLITISKPLAWTPDHVFASTWISNRRPQLSTSETPSPPAPRSIPAELQCMAHCSLSHAQTTKTRVICHSRSHTPHSNGYQQILSSLTFKMCPKHSHFPLVLLRQV